MKHTLISIVMHTLTHTCAQLLLPTRMPILVRGQVWYCWISWGAQEVKLD